MVVKGSPLWVDAKDEWPFGCQSCVSTTCWNCSISRLTRGTISSPLGTASAPPGQKSFCTSMTMSASSAVGVILPAMTAPPKRGRTIGARGSGATQRRGPPSAGVQPLGVPADVVADEGRHEIVRVVVARLHAQGQRHVPGLAGLGEQLRAQLRASGTRRRRPGRSGCRGPSRGSPSGRRNRTRPTSCGRGRDRR